MPKGMRMYARMPLEEACEELIKLVIFDKIKYPALATSSSKETREIVIPKLLERSNHIELFPEYRVGRGDIKFQNDVRLFLFDSTYLERVRGCQYDLLWMHNPLEWSHPKAFYDMLMFGLRLSDHPIMLEST